MAHRLDTTSGKPRMISDASIDESQPGLNKLQPVFLGGSWVVTDYTRSDIGLIPSAWLVWEVSQEGDASILRARTKDSRTVLTVSAPNRVKKPSQAPSDKPAPAERKTPHAVLRSNKKRPA